MLQVVIGRAKAQGLQVWTFDSDDAEIKQVFVTDGTRIASISRILGGLSVSSVHKPCLECGTGFGLSLENDRRELSTEEASGAMSVAMDMVAPRWATRSQRKAVRKWASWEEYMNRETVLTYYQL